MDSELIFYAARKTALCERALKKCFSELDLSLAGTVFASDVKDLGRFTLDGLEKYNVVFVVGGLGLGGNKSTKSIFARALSNAGVDEFKKLKNDSGGDGWVFRAGEQMIILLPDEPAQIESIMQGAIGKYIVKASP